MNEDGLLIRLMKHGRERVTAFLAMVVTGAATVWLTWSLIRHGHTEAWNWAFAALLTSVVANYITGKIMSATEGSAKEPKVQGGEEQS